MNGNQIFLETCSEGDWTWVMYPNDIIFTVIFFYILPGFVPEVKDSVAVIKYAIIMGSFNPGPAA
jgi:hypothetical protein